MADTVFLVEWDVRSPTTNLVETKYYATDPGYRTPVGDPDGPLTYEPRVANPGQIGRFIFGDGRTAGGSQISIGNVRLRNADSALDTFVADDWGVDGAALRIYIGNTEMQRGDFTLVAALRSAYIEATADLRGKEPRLGVEIVITDPMSEFDKPFSTTKYAGTNSGPTGLEGTADDLKGTVKPWTGGEVFNATGKPVNASLLIYQWSDKPVEAIPTVYDNGVPLNFDGDVATEASLISGTASSGGFITCVAIACAKLGASPAGMITADVSTGGGSAAASGTAARFNNAETLRFEGKVAPAASARVLGSFWLKLETYAPNDPVYGMPIIGNADDGIFAGVGSDGLSNRAHRKRLKFRVASTVDNLVTATTIPLAQWTHVAFAFDIPSQVFQVAIDGNIETHIATTASLPGPTGTMNFASRGTSVRIGGGYVPGSTENLLRGCLAEIYLAPDQWLDISDPVNMRAFRTLSGYPADLGNTGAAPTGTSPAIYLKGYGSDILVNRGAGFDATSSTLPAQCSDGPYATVTASSFAAATAGQIIQTIARERAGLTVGDIASADFAALDVAAPEIVGVFVDSERQIRDVLDEVAGSVCAWYSFKRDGTLTAGRFALPSSPVYTFDASNILSAKARAPMDEGNGIPAYSVVLKYYRNYTVQTTGVAGSVSASRRAFLEKDWRQINVPDNTVRQRHPKSPELTFESLVPQEADAQTIHDYLLLLYGVKRRRLLIEAPMSPETLALDLGQDVNVEIDVMGLGSGAEFKIIGVDYLLDRKVIGFDLWGGVRNAMSGSASGVAQVTGSISDYMETLFSGWWRADDVTYSSTGAVAQMNDRTGNGRPFTQAVAAAQPAWVSSDPLINNKPYLEFLGGPGADLSDTAYQCMTAPYDTGLFDVSAYTLYLVVRPDSMDGFGFVDPEFVSTNAVAIGGSPSPDRVFARQLDNTITDQYARAGVTLGEWVAVEVYGDGASIYMTVSGRVQEVTALPSVRPASGTTVKLGRSTDGGFYVFANMGVAEVIAVDATLGGGDRAIIRDYLADRYGISWELPRVNRTIPGGANRTIPGGAVRQVIDES